MSAASVSYLNFIGGEFGPSTSGNWLQKRDPRNGLEAGQLPDSDLMDVVRSVQASHKALEKWSKTTAKERAEILIRIADLIEKRAQDFAAAQALDLGIEPESTLRFSVSSAVEHFRAQAWTIAPELLGKETPPHIGYSLSSVGVVAIITPASDPLACLASRVAPALAYANAVIAKVSRYTPAVGVLFAEVCRESGLPAGVFNLLHGRGSEVGDVLVRHPAIAAISFMGSSEKGRVVAQTAAEAFKRMHYSMGAKNPVLVFASTDLDRSISQIAQICLGVHPSQTLRGSRLFVQETIFKTVLEALKAELDRIAVSPLAKPEQVTTYNDAVALALKENGKVVSGRAEVSGQFVKPYLFADLTNCSTLQQEEIAGPLILASSFKYQHEALKYANVSPYGRVGYIFESEEEKAVRVAQKLEAGSIFINPNEIHFDPLEEIPLLKSSGFAPEGGAALARFFSRSSKIYGSAQ